MRRSTAVTLGALLIVVLGLAGCDAFDSSPSNVEEFEEQPNVVTPAGRVATPDLSPTFSVEYQGLSGSPSAATESDIIELEELGTDTLSSTAGTKSWRIRLTTDNIEEVISEEAVTVTGNVKDGGGQVTDTLTVAASTSIVVRTNFTSSFATIADFEGDVIGKQRNTGGQVVDQGVYNGEEADDLDGVEEYTAGQRTIETSGETDTSLAITDTRVNNPVGSNGVRYLEVEGSGSGSVSIDRAMNLPNSRFFSFLVRPNASFSLTVTLLEKDESGTQTHEITLPLPGGGQWFKIAIPFDFYDGLDPVMPRAGGNGGLTSIEFSANASVNYGIDEIVFGETALGGRAEFHDFDRTTQAYGPPFAASRFQFVTDGEDDTDPDSLGAENDGLTARRVISPGPDAGGRFFGYNYDRLFLDVDANDVLSFQAKGDPETAGADGVYVFLQTPDGEGGYTFGNGTSVSIEDGSWQTIEIPLGELGTDPDALLDPGISNVGFNENDSFLIDDIKIVPKE
jgi:hypothetical protein